MTIILLIIQTLVFNTLAVQLGAKIKIAQELLNDFQEFRSKLENYQHQTSKKYILILFTLRLHTN